MTPGSPDGRKDGKKKGEAASASQDKQHKNKSGVGTVRADKVAVVHPTVLLAVADHYTRTRKEGEDRPKATDGGGEPRRSERQKQPRRVVGALLGEVSGPEVHITNSFALPFDEDAKKEDLWVVDKDYLEQMFYMFKKINAKDRVVGWYSSGPKIRKNDIVIHELFRNFHPHPLFVIVDVNAEDSADLTSAYLSLQEPSYDRVYRNVFVHVASTVGAYEAEEVGVEYLLRGTRRGYDGELQKDIGEKVAAVDLLAKRLRGLAEYIGLVLNGTLPPNPTLLYKAQEILNACPSPSGAEGLPIDSALLRTTNDSALALYLGSVTRAVLALHSVINNKLELQQQPEKEKDGKEKEKDGKKKDTKDGKEKDNKDGKEKEKEKDGKEKDNKDGNEKDNKDGKEKDNKDGKTEETKK
eukprot:GHVU01197445.1.p1 GENE.GHVU01197445.1~~GHVU01197445.1.p1  ORF type:complete len:411 (-),score=122.16 GHVU01197445.1:690-1922(-)